MTRLSPARKHALDALCAADSTGAYVRDLLTCSDSKSKLDRRDLAFASRLALGVTATKGCLDELLDAFIARPNKVSSRVRMALRIAAFELVYLDSEPRVAVSQGVELVRGVAQPAAGMANAVLRRVADAKDDYLGACGAFASESACASVARGLGIPLWLASEISDSRGPVDAHGLDMVSNLDPAPLCVHANPAHGHSWSSYISGLDEVFPGAYVVHDPAAFIGTDALRAHDCVVSDLSAQLIATLATRSGSCLEIGAGRGTKTFIMACQASRSGFEHSHVALDLYERKCALNKERMDSAGLGERISYLSGDACELDAVLASVEACTPLSFDTVFIDAPCSGTGTMRRHPEIPWRLKREDVDSDLHKIQLSLLRSAAAHVQKGGELIYATCSMLEQENRGVVSAFLASDEGASFEIAPVSEADIFRCEGFSAARKLARVHETEEGYLQTFPLKADDFDGHFCARLIRAK